MRQVIWKRRSFVWHSFNMPSRIIDASTLNPFNDENNNKYKNGNGENAEEQKAQFIRAYV